QAGGAGAEDQHIGGEGGLHGPGVGEGSMGGGAWGRARSGARSIAVKSGGAHPGRPTLLSLARTPGGAPALFVGAVDGGFEHQGLELPAGGGAGVGLLVEAEHPAGGAVRQVGGDDGVPVASGQWPVALSPSISISGLVTWWMIKGITWKS